MSLSRSESSRMSEQFGNKYKHQKDRYTSKAYDVFCTLCKAKIGAPCVIISNRGVDKTRNKKKGDVSSSPHAIRYRDAKTHIDAVRS